MSIQGKATIELTDVNTGKVEVVEENNLVTNGIKLFYEKGLNNILQIKHLNIMPNGTSKPAVYDLFGGIIVFSEALTEDPDNYEYPSCDTIATACAGRTNVAAAKLGSYNSAESGPLENGYKFVFDFSTSQANGEIGSVCLTPTAAATATYGQNANECTLWTSNLPWYLDNQQIYGYSNGCATPYYARYCLLSGKKADMHVFFDDTYIYNVKLHNLIYNSTNAHLHISQTKELIIEKRLIDNTVANIFDYVGGMVRCDETITIPIQGDFSASTYICQYVEDYLYVYPISQINNGSTLPIHVIDVNTWSLVDTKHILNETGAAWPAGYVDGILRMMVPHGKLCTTDSNGYIYLVDIETGIHTTVTTDDGMTKLKHNNGSNGCSVFTKNLILFPLHSGNSYTPYAIHIESARAYRIPMIFENQTGGNYTTFSKRGYPNICKSQFREASYNTVQDGSKMMFIPYILMTINNLSSKVIKTSDKTMKITYILYDDTVTT